MDAIKYRSDKDFAIEAWLRHYHACGWYRNGTALNLEAILSHAYLIVTAWRDDEMIGTLTVLSDGMNYATIDDFVVRPEWRRQGIGSKLMQVALANLKHIDPDLIRLNAIPEVEPFYERLGSRGSMRRRCTSRDRIKSEATRKYIEQPPHPNPPGRRGGNPEALASSLTLRSPNAAAWSRGAQLLYGFHHYPIDTTSRASRNISGGRQSFG